MRAEVAVSASARADACGSGEDRLSSPDFSMKALIRPARSKRDAMAPAVLKSSSIAFVKAATACDQASVSDASERPAHAVSMFGFDATGPAASYGEALQTRSVRSKSR